MPTMPTSTSNWNWRAAPPSRVKMAVPLPYGLALTRSTRLVVGVDAHHAEHRAEDLVVVARHVGRDVVEQRGAEEEAVAGDVDARPSTTTRGALAGGAVDVAGHPVAVLAR